MSLLGEVHVGLGSDKDAWYMVQGVLLLNDETLKSVQYSQRKAAQQLTRRLEIYEKEFVSLESYT